ncbi:MAG: hypothetical protein AAFV77_06330 [Planctomycetota bacterium]
MRSFFPQGYTLPESAEPYVAAAIALAAAFLFYWAITRALKRDRTTRRRVGDALGFTGLGICFATLAASVAFDIDSILVPIIAFGSGMVLGGIGGTMAGWQRS